MRCEIFRTEAKRCVDERTSQRMSEITRAIPADWNNWIKSRNGSNMRRGSNVNVTQSSIYFPVDRRIYEANLLRGGNTKPIESSQAIFSFFFFFFWDYRRISNGRDVNEFGAIVCSIDVFTRVGTRWIYNSRSFLSIVSQKCEYRFIFHFCFYNTVSP